LPALAALAVVTVLGAITFGLAGFLETNAAFGTVLDLEETYICDAAELELEFPNISRLSEVYTDDGVLLGKLTERNSQPTAISDIPDLVKWAVLAAEDGAFYDHRGIDFRAIARAGIETATSGNLQGGSTITQQIVKKNFLSDDRTIERKLCEAVIAAELEERYTKDEILEFYINSQFFGENAYGAKAAAQEYWGKDLQDVTVAEAAAMVIPIRNPSLYHLRNNPVGVLGRRNAVIDQMVLNGFITSQAGDEAKLQPLAPIEEEEFEDVSPQVMIFARELLLNDARYGLGDTPLERKRALFGCPAYDEECEGGGGLTVRVTVDLEQQEEANRLLRSTFRDPDGPTGAIAMIDNKTGAIKVMAGGLVFGEDIESGQRTYDLARKGKRQSGSAFKPFTLLAALESGAKDGSRITLGSFFDATSPQLIDCGRPCDGGSSIWRVSGGGNAIRSLEHATYASTNTVFAQLAVRVGPDKVADMANRLGIQTSLNRENFSITLGTDSVSPLEMAAAYSTIANYGMKVEQYLIESIEDADGNIIYQHEIEPVRVLDEALTAAAVGAMRKVVSGGTATRARIDRPQAGKTGTTQKGNDVWFMGFIPQYTTAVWVGHADGSVAMSKFSVFNDRTGEPQYHARAYGGTVAAPIWRQFMQYVTTDLPIQDFPEDPPGTGAYRATPEAEVPDVFGLNEKEARSAIYQAGFHLEFVFVASGQPEGTILAQIPEAGTNMRQGKKVVVQVSSGQVLDAFNDETGLDLSYTIDSRPSADPATWGTVVATSPAAGTLLAFQQEIVVFIGVPPPPVPGAGTP
jgi:penicillin-binding protein 1A